MNELLKILKSGSAFDKMGALLVIIQALLSAASHFTEKIASPTMPVAPAVPPVFYPSPPAAPVNTEGPYGPDGMPTAI